jgi:hypothetical protein
MTDSTAPRGDCGGLDEFLSKVNSAKKVGRLMGADEKGNKNVDLPAWFERRGIRTFAVDSGLGRVLCRVPRVTIDTKGADDIPEDQMVPLIMAALVTLPETWVGEETFALKCGVEVKEGERLPTPSAVLAATKRRDKTYDDAAALSDQRDYLTCLPKSLPGQVFIGLGYMTLAPLPSDPTPSA